MPANVTNALVFIVHSIAQLYLLVLLLRLWLPWLGADFRNPLAQAILRLTSPEGKRYEWQPDSTYIRKPPYFEGITSEPDALGNIHAGQQLDA